jgi:hypothetical protein
MRSPDQSMIQWSLVNTLGSFFMVIPVSIEDRKFLNHLTNCYLLKLDCSIRLLLSAGTGLLHTVTVIC